MLSIIIIIRIAKRTPHDDFDMAVWAAVARLSVVRAAIGVSASNGALSMVRVANRIDRRRLGLV